MPDFIRSSSRQSLRWKFQLLALLVLSFSSAHRAFAQKVTVEFDDTVNFNKYRTFAIREGDLNSKDPALDSELVKKQIDEQIERYLTAKGLTKVSGPSDLNVLYRLGSARRAETEVYPAGWRGIGRRYVRVPYSEGTLVINLRDPATRSLVWRSIATVEKSDASKVKGKLDDMVKNSLEKYPPKQK